MLYKDAGRGRLHNYVMQGRCRVALLNVLCRDAGLRKCTLLFVLYVEAWLGKFTYRTGKFILLYVN